MPSGAQFGEMTTRTMTCDSDLSEKAGYAVNLDTTDEENVNIAAAATALPFLLVEGAVGAAGAKATCVIALSGRALAKAGGVIAPGDKLTSDGNGKWIKTVTDRDHYGAVALEIGADGDEIEVSVERGMISAA